LVGLWCSLVVGWLWWSRSTGQGATESLQQLIGAIRGRWWAAPAFVAVYGARPLLLFPASVLTVAGGVLFGPVTGTAVVIVAANLSAMVAFGIGRWFRGADRSPTQSSTTVLARWSDRVRANSFAAVLTMRLAYLPYDLVNYGCGALGVQPAAFLAATAIGSLPGTVSFVLAGASLQRVDRGLAGFDPKIFAISAALFVISLALARRLQRRDRLTRSDV
jgi:uncharacterized membrane protein YdjX (TVP38/TMEM64 family)